MSFLLSHLRVNWNELTKMYCIFSHLLFYFSFLMSVFLVFELGLYYNVFGPWTLHFLSNMPKFSFCNFADNKICSLMSFPFIMIIQTLSSELVRRYWKWVKALCSEVLFWEPHTPVLAGNVLCVPSPVIIRAVLA